MSTFKPKLPPDHPRAWVDELMREIALRKGVYSKRVEAGSMSPEESAFRIAAIENVVAFVQAMHSQEGMYATVLTSPDGKQMGVGLGDEDEVHPLFGDWTKRSVVDARGLARFQRMHDQAKEPDLLSRTDVLPSEFQPLAPVKVHDPRPANCRNRLQMEGKAYPRSSCAACKDFLHRGCPHEPKP